MVLCTNGDKGTADRERTSERLAATREREQLGASSVFGAKDTVFPQGHLLGGHGLPVHAGLWAALPPRIHSRLGFPTRSHPVAPTPPSGCGGWNSEGRIHALRVVWGVPAMRTWGRLGSALTSAVRAAYLGVPSARPGSR